jgi:serine/threonine protein kinase
MTEREVFEAALELPAENRAAFLDGVCGGDAALRLRLEALLCQHDQAGSFLENPALTGGFRTASAPGSPGPPAEAVGRVLAGRYKLLQQIGEGGMGTVFLARQTEPVQRLVAVKLIRSGMDSRAMLTRFEAERQALALMDHPNIARVLDGGATPDGRPYFVMDLVQGVPITRYCDEQCLTPRQRLELFVSVCQAIQHAHQKGIIHRDIKPSNVLVAHYDDRPVVKVIDFGVAKATGEQLSEQTPHTGLGTIVGTVEYMSPEQASLNNLDVDTRSDVYSLGVLLYELLTGAPPFRSQELKQAGLLEVLRVIREQEPPRPSTKLSTADGLPALAANRGTEPKRLTALVRGELDWIVMKALEKDRTRRYETATDFAADVQRYLDNEPVAAGPPSASYRLRKFIRRNKGPVLAAALVVLALLGGMVGTTLGLVRAEQRREEAEQARHNEAIQRATAQANAHKALAAAAEETKAREQVQKHLTQVERGIQLLGSIFENLDPNAEEKEGKPLRVLLGERLDLATRELEGETIGAPLAVARLQRTLGCSQWALGYPEKAIALLVKARATFTTRLGPDHRDTLWCMSELALAYHSAGELELAVSLFEETLQRQKTALGPDHPDTLTSMNNLAEGYRSVGKLDRAFRLWEEMFRLSKAKGGLNHSGTLMWLNNLVMGYEEAGMLDQARPLMEVILRRAKAAPRPDQRIIATCMNNLAGCYKASGDFARALPLYEDALKIRTAKLGPVHPDTLGSRINLASAHAATGKLAVALQQLEEVLPLTKDKLGPNHPVTIICMSHLASAYHKARKLDLALPLFQETLHRQKAKFGPDHFHTLIIMSNFAECYRDAGKLDLALPLTEETLRRHQAKGHSDHPQTFTSMNNLAVIYLALKQFDRALPLLEETLKLRKARSGPDHSDTLVTMNNLAGGYKEAGNLKLAMTHFGELLKRQRATLGADDPRTLKSMDNLATCYRDDGKLDIALPLFEEVVERRTAKFGRDHADTLRSSTNLAWIYWSLKQLDRSVPLFEELVPLCKRVWGEEDRDTLTNMSNLGVNYMHAGRLPEAIPLLEEAYRKSLKQPELAAWIGTQLVSAYTQGGKKTEAVAVLKAELASARRHQKPGGLLLSDALASIGAQYLDLRAYADAEPLLRECVAIRSKLIAGAWQTFAAKSLFGRALLGQKKYAEAEPLLLSGYEGLKQRDAKIPPHGKGYLPEALEGLVQLHDAQGKHAEAARWQKILDESRAAKRAGKPKEK